MTPVQTFTYGEPVTVQFEGDDLKRECVVVEPEMGGHVEVFEGTVPEYEAAANPVCFLAKPGELTKGHVSAMRWILNGRRTRAFRAHTAFVNDGVITVYNEAKGELQAFDAENGDALGADFKGRLPRLVAFDDPEALRLAHETHVADLSAKVSTAMRAFNDDVSHATRAALLKATEDFATEALRLVNGEPIPVHLLDPNNRD